MRSIGVGRGIPSGIVAPERRPARKRPHAERNYDVYLAFINELRNANSPGSVTPTAQWLRRD